MSEGESKLIINTTFILDSDVEITIKNINIETLNKLNNSDILRLILETKWYMYGIYDKCTVLSAEYTITSKTKKKIELVRTNIEKIKNA
jgi:TRAP-type mannitol/chloroaromatic compound transport system permease small subunit